MAGAWLLESPSPREEGIGHPVPGTDLDAVADPAPVSGAEVLGLGDRCPCPRGGPDGSHYDPPLLGWGGGHRQKPGPGGMCHSGGGGEAEGEDGEGHQ